MPSSSTSSSPIVLSASVQAQTYALLALAMALSAAGTFIGLIYAVTILSTGVHLFFLIAELAIIFTAQLWMDRRPWNYLLFALFPLLSGITFAPYVLFLLAAYVNGAVILFNAVVATTFLCLAAAVFARVAPDLSGLARGLLFALLGIILFTILQIFVPSLQTGGAELFISGIGIAVFGLFLSLDIQRVARMGRLGFSPFLLALSLYLDIFNLLLMVLRFMTAFSGRRR